MGLTHSNHGKRAQVVKELERFTKPTGLYPTCSWDDKVVRKLVLEGRVAPLFQGMEHKHKSFPTKECPICFLRHVVLNKTRCCRKQLCTECYLQIRKPKAGPSPCPFCNHGKLACMYGTDDEEKMVAQEMANIRLYDMLTAPPYPISFAGALTTDTEKTEAQVAALVLATEAKVVSHESSSTATTSTSSRKVYGGVNIPFATVKERHMIEDEAQKQHLVVTDDEGDEENEDEGLLELGAGLFSLGARGRNRGHTGLLFGSARGGGGRQGGRRAQEHAHVRRALLQSLGVPSQLEQVEEMMLMAAIRQSLQEVGLEGSGGGGGGGGGDGGGGQQGEANEVPQQQQQEQQEEETKETGGDVVAT